VPDPASLAAVDLTNPQTWNRYAYVANNPLSYVDPYGLYANDPCGGSGSAGSGSDGDDGDDWWWLNTVGGGGNDGGNDGGDDPPSELLRLPGTGSGAARQTSQLLSHYGSFAGNSGPLARFQKPVSCHKPQPAPSAAANNAPGMQPCLVKVQNAVNNALNTSSTYLGPTSGPGLNSQGYRNGAYNFNFFAPGVTNPVLGSTNGSGRFPGSGLHIPLPGGQDPTITPWGYNAQAGGSYFTAHYDSANPTDDLISFFQHIINDVILRRPHGC